MNLQLSGLWTKIEILVVVYFPALKLLEIRSLEEILGILKKS